MWVWLAFCTDWQHWMLPVEHELAGSVEAGADAVEVTVTVTVVGSFHGMATARTARERRESEVRANMFWVTEGALGVGVRWLVAAVVAAAAAAAETDVLFLSAFIPVRPCR